MPRDYKSLKKKKNDPFASRFSNGISFLAGLTLGLIAAVIVYFQQHGAVVATNNVLLNDSEQVSAPVSSTPINKKTEVLPGPKFDFYKILPNKEVNISEWESVAEEVSPPSAEQSDMFVLQAGSFKEFQAADEVKAKLALMGVNANIQRVVINGQDVRHRVRIGPYKDSSKLQKVKDRLLANHINFMLLKLKM